jgi:hypothetical protein
VSLLRSGESLGWARTMHLSPYMKPLGSDFSNGANFAIAGSPPFRWTCMQTTDKINPTINDDSTPIVISTALRFSQG